MSLWMTAGRTQFVDGRDPAVKRRPLVRRLAALTAVLVGVPVLTLGLTGRTAAASGAGQVTIYTGTGIYNPYNITAGPDGALWFTNDGSIGRISTAGKIAIFTGTGIYDPYAITAGPDGALWFTNSINNSIGRITTAGVVTNFRGYGISFPRGITAGPDGALWFTNWLNNSIGRITTAGAVTNYTGGSPTTENLLLAARSAGLRPPEW